MIYIVVKVYKLLKMYITPKTHIIKKLPVIICYLRPPAGGIM